MKNIELFDTYTAKIFSILYQKFPVGQVLDAQEISGCPGTDDYGVMKPEADVCLATMKWLKESGYIRSGNDYAYGCMDAVLTAKGLEALRAMPKSIDGKTPIGERIVNLVKTGSMGLAKEAARQAVSLGTHLILKG